MNAKTPQLTKARARSILQQAREDIAMLMSRQFETQQEIHRLLQINTELFEGLTGEEAPEMHVRPVFEEAS